MPFIEQIEKEDAQGELKAIYDEMWDRYGGRLPPVMKIMGLNAPVMKAVMDLNRAATFGASTLGRRKEEMIATAVSSWNGCPY